VEKSVLLSERLDIGACMGLFGLECHVCIGDFGNRGAEMVSAISRVLANIPLDLQEEHDSQYENKASDCEVDPLHILQGFWRIANVSEEDIAGKDGRNHGSCPFGSDLVQPLSLMCNIPTPLNAWLMLIRISEYLGGPQTGKVSIRQEETLQCSPVM